MWTDNETDKDFVNFESISKTVAEIIVKANNAPISIGVSGSWGVGKSSLIKLVNKSLKEKAEGNKKKYIFVEFNAWLYQGYDDARAALMETIANELIEASKENAGIAEKAKNLLKRVNWLRVTQFAAKTAIPMAFGLPPVGLVGDVINNAKALLDGATTQDKLDEAMKTAASAAKKANGFLKDQEEKSPPKEIQAIRDEFEETLAALDATLVVLIDDLDRCLPDTTISTLEAIRLFLFLPNTAFVVAADTQMIKHAVRKHFSGIEDKLVTSYFDKLIQIPIQVPPLGTQEVRAYMMLLFVDNSSLDDTDKSEVVSAVNKQLTQSWKGLRVDRNFMNSLAQTKKDTSLATSFDLVERLSLIMTTSKEINGNPRLIKRFLNALSIRKSIAFANGIDIDEEALAKMLLFERCGDTKCYQDILNAITSSTDGTAEFIKDWEDKLSAGEKPQLKEHWSKNSFELDWLNLEPKLGAMDLRGIMYIGREYAPIITPEDQLSPEAIEILTAITTTPGTAKGLEAKIKGIHKNELMVVVDKIFKNAKKIHEWGSSDILDDLITFASLDQGISDKLSGFLADRPIDQIKPAIVPKIRSYSWSKAPLTKWYEESDEGPLRKAIAKELDGGKK